MPLAHAATYLGYVRTHWLDPIQICTYISGSMYKRLQVPARELQFSSRGFPPQQPVRSSPEPTASILSQSPLDFNSLDHQLTLLPLGCFRVGHCHRVCMQVQFVWLYTGDAGAPTEWDDEWAR